MCVCNILEHKNAINSSLFVMSYKLSKLFCEIRKSAKNNCYPHKVGASCCRAGISTCASGNMQLLNFALIHTVVSCHCVHTLVDITNHNHCNL